MKHAHSLRHRGLVMVVAGVLLVACGTRGDPEGHAGGPRAAGPPVLVIGDSLTVGARLWGDLEGVLVAAGWQPDVVAEDGRAVDWGLAQVRARRRVPAVVVVGLGTNPGPAAAAFAEDVRTMVAALAARGAETVVWVPPGDTRDPGRAARARSLREAAGGPLRVPDWPAVLAAHRQWVAGDGIHLTPDGYRALAELVRDHLPAPDG